MGGGWAARLVCYLVTGLWPGSCEFSRAVQAVRGCRRAVPWQCQQRNIHVSGDRHKEQGSWLRMQRQRCILFQQRFGRSVWPVTSVYLHVPPRPRQLHARHVFQHHHQHHHSMHHKHRHDAAPEHHHQRDIGRYDPPYSGMLAVLMASLQSFSNHSAAVAPLDGVPVARD